MGYAPPLERHLRVLQVPHHLLFFGPHRPQWHLQVAIHNHTSHGAGVVLLEVNQLVRAPSQVSYNTRSLLFRKVNQTVVIISDL